jgi:signal transduction histidine kinase
MRPPYDSLRFRLMAVAFVGAVASLAVAGLVIAGVFREHLADQFREDLRVHLAELSSIAQVNPEGRPTLRQPLPDPRFQAFGSNYWQIEREGHPTLRSPSLAGATLSGRFAIGAGPRHGEADGPRGKVLEYGRTLNVADGGPPLRLSLASEMSVLAGLLDSSNQMVTLALLVLGLVLVGGGAVQLIYGLRPLDRLGRAIAEMRGGGRAPDGETFPSEIRPLIHDLTSLLHANAEIVQRARVEAGNLAHGLRTPLAIVMDEAERLGRSGRGDAAASLLEQCVRMQKQIDYHMARSRAAGAVRTPGLTTRVKSTLQPILSAMQRLHGPRGVIFEAAGGPDVALACDPQDFAEVASALLDNAGKWATSKVHISWRLDGQAALIAIEDDGPGLAPTLREGAFAIGERLDETVAGSGLGLAIARDLATLYGGSVWLDDSVEGSGLRALISLPVTSGAYRADARQDVALRPEV